MHWCKENDILELSLPFFGFLLALSSYTFSLQTIMKTTILLQTKRMHSITERRKIQNSWMKKCIAYFFYSTGIEKFHLEHGSGIRKVQYCIHWCSCSFMSEEIIQIKLCGRVQNLIEYFFSFSLLFESM